MGEGIEREIFFNMWNRFQRNHTRFFTERDGGFCTVNCLSSVIAANASVGRIRELKRLGAAAALMCIHGQFPAPLSPAVLLYTIYDHDFHCLTPTFIGEWFPDLRKLISDWLEMGPDGDPMPFSAHFASYLDRQVSHLKCYIILICSNLYFYRYRLQVILAETFLSTAM